LTAPSVVKQHFDFEAPLQGADATTPRGERCFPPAGTGRRR